MPALEKLHRTINSSCGKNHTWFTKIIITTRSKHIGGCIGGGIIYYKFGTE